MGACPQREGWIHETQSLKYGTRDTHVHVPLAPRGGAQGAVKTLAPPGDTGKHVGGLQLGQHLGRASGK